MLNLLPITAAVSGWVGDRSPARTGRTSVPAPDRLLDAAGPGGAGRRGAVGGDHPGQLPGVRDDGAGGAALRRGGPGRGGDRGGPGVLARGRLRARVPAGGGAVRRPAGASTRRRPGRGGGRRRDLAADRRDRRTGHPAHPRRQRLAAGSPRHRPPAAVRARRQPALGRTVPVAGLPGGARTGRFGDRQRGRTAGLRRILRRRAAGRTGVAPAAAGRPAGAAAGRAGPGAAYGLVPGLLPVGGRRRGPVRFGGTRGAPDRAAAVVLRRVAARLRRDRGTVTG